LNTWKNVETAKEGGDDNTHQGIMLKAERKSQARVMKNEWNALTSKQEQIIALKAQIASINSFKKRVLWANSNVSSKKCVTIMALKPNKLQVITSRSQANASIERLHKVVNDMLRSFDLENENNHENLETQEDNPFDYFLQSNAWLPCY
jgi:hypothetical protein